MALTRAGLVGLYTVAFYFLKGLIVWSLVVVVLVLVPHAGDVVTQNMIT